MIQAPEEDSAGVRVSDWPGWPDDDDWFSRVHDEETIRKTFTLSGDHRSIEVDNVFGSIEVVGTDGNEVQLVVKKTLHAESKEKLEEARKKVTLGIDQSGNSLRLYVDGPFRHHDDDFWGFGNEPGYWVSMEFQLQVPRKSSVQLKTVNGGVRVRDVSGEFTIRCVSGGIGMENVAGSGTVHTVNGPLKVKFRENPTESWDFGSINGAVELSFAPKLNADFRLHTFNGSVDSAFAMDAANSTEISHEGMKTIYRANHFGGRVGSGGPEIRVSTLNGAIRLLENHE